MGPKELKVQLRELDTNYNLSSFLEGITKMADIDIYPFSYHDKLTHILMKQAKLSLSTQKE